MDYEKMYKDALSHAKQAYGTGAYDDSTLEAIFPELAESEDEVTRKWILDYLCDGLRKSDKQFKDQFKSAIAWLEKQKEQKPEHFELKAGHWYICHRAFCCRADHLTVKEGEQFMCEKDGVVKGFVIKEPEKYFKECSAPAPMEDEQKEQNPHYTKRNALFDKCVENCDPEVMKEVSDNIDEMLQKEQHPSSRFLPGDWVVYDGPLGYAILQVKDVVGGRYTFVDNDSTLLVEDSDKFMRPLTPKDVEKPAEWSDEDEKIRKTLLDYYEKALDNYTCVEWLNGITYGELCDWLKSLRPSWKPSEEQMSMLLAVINDPNNAGAESCYMALKSIYNNLKKL